MTILLDTNICIYVLKSRPPSVLQRFQGYAQGELGISLVTALELRVGALRSGSQRSAAYVQALLNRLTIHPLDASVQEPFAQTKVALMRAGALIGAFDLLIAAHALSLGATLVTNNEREFRRVPGLTVDNWI